MSDHTLSPRTVLEDQVDDHSLLDAFTEGTSAELRDWKTPTNGSRKRWPKRTAESWREVMITVGLVVEEGVLYKVWWEIAGGQWKRSAEAIWGHSHHEALNQVHDESSRREAWVQYLEWVAEEGSDPLSVLNLSENTLVPWRVCAEPEEDAVTIYAARRLEEVGGRAQHYMTPGHLPKGLLKLCRGLTVTGHTNGLDTNTDRKHAIAPKHASDTEDLAKLIEEHDRTSIADTSLAEEQKHIETENVEGMPDDLFVDMMIQESSPPSQIRDRVREAAEEQLDTQAPIPV